MFSRKITKPGVLAVWVLGAAGCVSTGTRAPVADQSPEPVPVPEPVPESVQLIGELNAVQDELKRLRDSIEQQQFEVQNLSQRQRDLYDGLDRRLQTLESTPQAYRRLPGQLPVQHGSANPAQVSTAQVGSQAAALPGTAAESEVSVLQNDAGQVVVSVPAVPGQPVGEVSQPGSGISEPVQRVTVAAAGTVTAAQQAMYDTGFDLLKQSRYVEAASEFQALTTQHPQSALADDAMYWVGEANYVNRQYEAAIAAFRRVVSQYPGSDRVPEALLKVGYVQYEIGDYEQAKATFTDVISRYPNHPVASSANSRLQRIAN